MTIAKVEVERFSLTSLKPFDAVVAAFKSAIGEPNMVEVFKETRATNSFPDLDRVVKRGLGRTDLMLFAQFDLGDILRRETGVKTPKIMRFVVGNPLIMKEWSNTCPMLDLTLRSQCSSMSVPMACTSPMTKWRAFCCIMAARKPLLSPEISM
jgi:hypothetical protein